MPQDEYLVSIPDNVDELSEEERVQLALKAYQVYLNEMKKVNNELKDVLDDEVKKKEGELIAEIKNNLDQYE